MPDSATVCYEVGIIKKEKCFDAKSAVELSWSLPLNNDLKRYFDLRTSIRSENYISDEYERNKNSKIKFMTHKKINST